MLTPLLIEEITGGLDHGKSRKFQAKRLARPETF